MADFAGSPVQAHQFDAVAPKEGVAMLHWLTVNYTHAAGTGTGEVDVCTLPAGSLRLLTPLCHYATSQYATSAALSIGLREYVDAAGDTVNEDASVLLDTADVATGAVPETPCDLPVAGYLDVNSHAGIVVFATIDGGNIENGDTLEFRAAWLA